MPANDGAAKLADFGSALHGEAASAGRRVGRDVASAHPDMRA